jgi:hypothetical protein
MHPTRKYACTHAHAHTNLYIHMHIHGTCISLTHSTATLSVDDDGQIVRHEEGRIVAQQHMQDQGLVRAHTAHHVARAHLVTVEELAELFDVHLHLTAPARIGLRRWSTLYTDKGEHGNPTRSKDNHSSQRQ